jgi:hypothetical protein
VIHYIVKSIPHDQQEYDTMGNWRRLPDDTMLIEVDDMGDWRKELIVAIHEMVEAALCQHRGISEQSVSDYDKSHPDSPQPGDELDAPYRLEHEFATDIERLIGRALDVDLQSY